MEKRGIRTERGDLNREIEVTNQKIRRSVYNILRQEQREQQTRRAQDMER